MTRLASVGWALVVAASTPLAAQGPASAPAPASDTVPEVRAVISNTTRVESWRFFETPVPGVDPDYDFFGNRSDLGIQSRGNRFDLSGGFSYVRVEQLPTDAIGPGPLGTGAYYFAASGFRYSYQAFLTDLTVAVHARDRRVTVTAGRMPYTSGAEGSDARPGRSAGSLSELRRLRLDGRLLGTFAWSFYQRRYDGVRVDVDGVRAYGGAAGFFVTQGVYEESANLTMTKLQVGSAWAGWRHGSRAETQLFVHGYRDRRAIDFRPDNAGVRTDAADVSVLTVGLSHLGVARTGPGELDGLFWGAAQGGDWYGQPHRAWAAAVEGGYRWPSSRWKPWTRAGVSWASGDDAPSDARHETFFPMLADGRTYAQSLVYAPMNLRDVFVQLVAEPHPRARLRLDLHALDLVTPADRWYQGAGATASRGHDFGYSIRSSGGARDLGRVLESSVDLTLSRYWSINAYVARMWGGPVVNARFTGNRLFYWYVENVLKLEMGK